MSDNEQINALRRELTGDRIVTIRCWVIFLGWALLCWVPEFRCIFNSMNIELPLSSKLLLGGSNFVSDWWFFVIPAGWISWRAFEDRWLLRQSARTLRVAAFIGLALAFLGNMALQQPLLKLINNVG